MEVLLHNSIIPTNVQEFLTLAETFFISKNNFAIGEHIISQ